MDEARAGALEEIAKDAGIERASFLTDAGARFTKFLEDNEARLKEFGGLVLIDDDPEYLAITEDGAFKSRTRVQDDSGEWVSQDETIESGAELVEIYNPADLYAAFADAAREEAGLPSQPLADELVEATAVGTEPRIDEEEDDIDDELVGTPEGTDDAARMLYDLALTYQERSQRSQARLLDQFQDSSDGLAAALGDSMFIDEEDERLWYRSSGAFEAEVVPEEDEETGEPKWQTLSTAEDVVQFYDPTDLFGDLAEAIAESNPSVAPELEEGNAQE